MATKNSVIYRTLRTSAWWEYKLPATLGIGYATALTGTIPLINLLPGIAFVLASIIVGAVFVSTINDITDIEDDFSSGKTNGMLEIRSKFRWIIPAICILSGVVFLYFYLPDKVSAVLYVLPWIAFSLYSFKPIRLKERGAWGLLADACGAHVFINLLMVSSISYISNQEIDIFWFIIVGTWSLFVGLRGILWHQYYDRENDLTVNLNTFATRVSPEQFRKYENVLIVAETLLFCCILIKISLITLGILLFIYVGLVFFRHKILGYSIIIILSQGKSGTQILMQDLYHVFFPIGMLAYASFAQEWAWVLLLLHILAFPRKIVIMLFDSLLISKQIIKRKSRTPKHVQI